MNKPLKLKKCPGSYKTGCETYTSAVIRRVFDGHRISHIMHPDSTNTNDIIFDNITNSAVPGKCKKFFATIKNGYLTPCQFGEQGQYIVKPIPENRCNLQNKFYKPANEHLTMQIARRVYGISTAENALIFFPDNNPAYVTKRFDSYPNGSKINQEDFGSLSQKTYLIHGEDFHCTGSYSGMGIVLKKFVAAWQVEIIKFFRIILFNYLFGNGNAHLKNFSLQQTINGDYILTPAYNLLNTSLHEQKEIFGLKGGLFDEIYYSNYYVKTGYPCCRDFETFGKLIGVPNKQLKKVIDQMSAKHELVYELIQNSFLNPKLKQLYGHTYEERLKHFTT